MSKITRNTNKKESKKDNNFKQLQLKKWLKHSIYCAIVFTLLFFALGIVIIISFYWWLGLILIIIALIQASFEAYLFWQIFYLDLDYFKLKKFENYWWKFLVMFNLLGAFYFAVTKIRKR